MPGKRYKDETNNYIKIFFFYGVAPKKIAADLNIDLSLIYRRKGRLKLFGIVNPSLLSV